MRSLRSEFPMLALLPAPLTICLLCSLTATPLLAQRGGRGGNGGGAITVLRPARVFDGEALREGWAVRVRGERIEAAGPAAGIDTNGAKVVDLPGLTLMPGM